MGKSNKRSQGQSTPVWDVLLGLSQAVGQLTNIPATLIPYLRDQEVVQKISDQPRFSRLAVTLEQDIRALTQRFRDIQVQHIHRKGAAIGGDALMQSINLHEMYVAWAADFDDIIMPTYADMVTMIANTGANIDTTLPSATGITQQHSP
ncbi:hypothetical protein [Xanthomonas phage RTH11]|nr:hypothetical protein [Xanthomonas phage RTH11]